ncbi:MAG: hypothetical protein JXB32_17440 [Deltaproteobacteria bacterium]|nr:hypothetical protein [Deltaproteobacteria bacterium]
MSIGKIGSGGAEAGWSLEPPEAAEPAAASNVSLDEVATLMVEADREERNGARAAQRALAEAARAERRAAIHAQRAAAADAFDSAILQAVVGGLTAVAQGVAAVGAAEAATAVEGAAGSAAGDAAAGVPWHRWVEIGAGALPHAAPLLDVPARRAEASRIRSQEYQDAAAFLEDRARQAGDDAEAARAARRAHVEAVGRALDSIEQGRSIAIGREAG